jgi:Leucine-rich repeat (LRR) protein
MNVDANILASLQLQYPQVRSINSNLSLRMIGLNSLHGLSKFKGVKCFDESSNVLEFVDPSHVSFISELRILKLQHNKITQVPSLVANPHLYTLDLSSNLVSSVSNLSHRLSLHMLLLSNHRLATAELLQDLSNCPLLETLEINSNMMNERNMLALLCYIALDEVASDAQQSSRSQSDSLSQEHCWHHHADCGA